MGYYNVVAPCVVDKLHYVRPTTQPIEIDDDTAAPLVEAGSLEPYPPGAGVFEILPDGVPLTDPLNTEVGQAARQAAKQAASDIAVKPFTADVTSDETDEQARPRGRRRNTEE